MRGLELPSSVGEDGGRGIFAGKNVAEMEEGSSLASSPLRLRLGVDIGVGIEEDMANFTVASGVALCCGSFGTRSVGVGA